ncbi:integrase, catalytic region, zinc finger, CCHC-type containing protein [Tanacetum coccineum]
MQLNTKYVIQHLPNGSRFITEVKLNRGLKESNFDQLYAYLKQHEVHANENRMMMERFSQPTNDPLVLVSNASNQKLQCGIIKENHFKELCQEELCELGMWRSNIIETRIVDSDYFKDKMLLMHAHENRAVLDEEQLLFLAEETTMFMENLTSEEAGASYDSNIPSEVQDREYDLDCEDKEDQQEQGVQRVKRPSLKKLVKVIEEIFDQMNDEVDQNTVDKQCAEIVKKNLLLENENLIANCLSNQLLYDVEKSRCLDLEAEMSKGHNKSKHISKLKREYLNLQLKYQHLQESFDNNKSQTSQKAPNFNSFYKIKNLEHQIQEKDNVIRDLKVLFSNVNDRSCEPYNANDVTALIKQNECVRVELEEVKQHYKELFKSIHITRASTNEKTSSLLTQIEDLKAQLEGNLKVAARSYVKTKVLAPGMYAIDVEPIPPRLKNNRNAHLTYINHLKESVETVREIVEEARVVKPLDNVLNYACQYTKLSQELVEYVIGTCPKEFTERDSKAPSIPLTRKKQVTFTDTCSTSTNNTQKHGVHQKTQPSNVQVIPSTGVSSSTRASGSKPRSNTKHNRILPAKSVNNKKVEDHPRTNKSVWTKVNRVDSSISSKHVVINSNSESVCKTCNKCLNSANHEMCVVNILSSVNATPTVKIVLNKGKQIWKPKGKLSDNSLNKTKQIWQPKGKLSDNSLNKTKQVWKATGKLFANVGYQWRPTGKKFTSGKLNCGYQWRPTGTKFALGELCPLTRLPVTCCSKLNLEEEMAPVRISSGPEPIMTLDLSSSSLVLYLKMFELSSSSLGLHCQKTFKQISSNLVSQMSQRRLLATLQAPFFKEKKGVRFSALYLQQKRNLLVLDHSHQQVSYFFHARSVVKWINVDQLIRKGYLLLDLQKLQKNPIFRISVDIRQNTNFVRAFTTSANVPSIYIQLFWNTLNHDVKTGVYSFQVNENWLTLSVFGALCYPTNDSEDLGKFQAKADIGIFVGYAPSRKFVEKFIGTVRFGNDHFGAIMGYGDYVIGDSVISRVYYVEGLGHNLFFVGQFCDSDLEVAFKKPKASKSKSWLWHRRLNHLNFGTINDLARKDLVRGLPRLKFEKDHLCSACQLGKSKKFSHKPKSENTNTKVLHTLHSVWSNESPEY